MTLKNPNSSPHLRGDEGEHPEGNAAVTAVRMRQPANNTNKIFANVVLTAG